MNKIKMTNAQLNYSNNYIVRVGYCRLQNLLVGLDAYAYNTGVYGWNWDAYDLGGGVSVCTGYGNLTGAIIEYKDLEEKAEAIRANYNMPYGEKEKRISALRAEFVERVKGAL